MKRRIILRRFKGRFYSRELKQQTFLSSRTSDCRGGLDRQRRFWREILMLSKTRSATRTGIFCLYFLTVILERWSFLLSIPQLKDVRNSLLIAHNISLLSDEELLSLLDKNWSENPQFIYEKYERFDIDGIEEADCKAEFRAEKKWMLYFIQLPNDYWHWTCNIEHYTFISKIEIKCSYIFQYKNKS